MRWEYFQTDIKSIQSLNRNTFILQPLGTEQLIRLTIKYEGVEAYNSKLILTEFSNKIVKFLGEKGQLFVLLRRGEHYSLKMFKINSYKA